MVLPFPVVLASASPRRVELLGTIVQSFEVCPADVDETPLAGEAPVQTALRLAEAKARLVAADHLEALVIGADTVVELNGRSFAKPEDAEDARRMLRALSGKQHRVTTAVSLAQNERIDSFFVQTGVAFRALLDEEIDDYVRTGEPMDKAGAYAIQGGAKSFAVAVCGSRSNVIGLPIEEVEKRLKALACNS